MSKKKPEAEIVTKQVKEAFPNLQLSSNQARKIVRIVSQQVSIKSGPFPSPEDYEHYLEIDPSLTDLMKKMVTDEQKHQHEMDIKSMNMEYKIIKRGQWFGFFIFSLIIGLGVYSIFSGFEWGGAIITAIGGGGVIAQFLRRK